MLIFISYISYIEKDRRKTSVLLLFDSGTCFFIFHHCFFPNAGVFHFFDGRTGRLFVIDKQRELPVP